ncbi:MAG: sigma-70 family RNA polymerase sigma factor [Ignavibacteriae bacterium]|nr:sigma-70 family RNA polymerase sigma factor [Ignavibacteriota bacterium]
MKDTSNKITDEQLIAEAVEGSNKALAELVKRYEQTVYNFAFKVCRNKDRAEHAMQETFMSMVKSLKQFSGKSKLSTWLYTIVSNHCLMLARSQKKYDYTSFENEDGLINEKNILDWKFSPEKLADNEELKKLLDDAISKLPHDYRIVFILRDVEGLSTQETSEIAKLTVPAVKSRLHRARAFLRNELNNTLHV